MLHMTAAQHKPKQTSTAQTTDMVLLNILVDAKLAMRKYFLMSNAAQLELAKREAFLRFNTPHPAQMTT